MNKEKISSQDIVDLLSSKSSISKRSAEEFIKAMITVLEEQLQVGESIKIKGFGTFKLQFVEPRKSVNVNTKAEIILEAYNKVSFTPDPVLRDLINEPFAHLNAVALDENNQPIIETRDLEDELVDPMATLRQHMKEIKEILADFHSDNSNSDVSETELLDYEISNPLVIKEQEKTSTVKSENASIEQISIPSENSVIDLEPTQEHVARDEKSPINSILDQNENSEEDDNMHTYQGNPYVQTVSGGKKTSIIWMYILIVLLLGVGVLSYFVYKPAQNYIDYNYSLFYHKCVLLKDNIVGLFEADSTESKPAITLPSVDSIQSQQQDSLKIAADSVVGEIDSMKVLFEQARIYTQFIATKKLPQGGRLALFAQRYYGSSDFWVYIYEANKDILSHPDSIKVGMMIKIPEIDPRLINVEDPRCIEYAKKLHEKYVGSN